MDEAMLKPQLRNLKTSKVAFIANKVRPLPAEKVFKFNVGVAPFPIDPLAVEQLRKHAHLNKYGQLNGIKPLREAISAWMKHYHKMNYHADNIMISVGSKICYFAMMKLFNGQILVPANSWCSYKNQNLIANYEDITIVETCKENDFFPTPDDYSKAEKKDADFKMTIITSPNNPTGYVLDAARKKELADYFRKNNYIVLEDEIYSHSLYDMNDFAPLAQFYKEGTIVVNGISKWGNACGWRIGFMAFPKELDFFRKRIGSVFSETVTMPPLPIQHAAVSLFRLGDQKYNETQAAINRILKSVGFYMAERLRKLGFDIKDPKAGIYLYVDLWAFKGQLNKKGIYTGEQLTECLFDKFCIAVIPAEAFYMKAEELAFRVAFTDFDGEKCLEKVRNVKGEFGDEFVEENCWKIVEGIKKFGEFVEWLNE